MSYQETLRKLSANNQDPLSCEISPLSTTKPRQLSQVCLRQREFPKWFWCACLLANSQIVPASARIPKLLFVPALARIPKSYFFQRCLALANSQISFYGFVRLVETISPLSGAITLPNSRSSLYESPVALFCERRWRFGRWGSKAFPALPPFQFIKVFNLCQ